MEEYSICEESKFISVARLNILIERLEHLADKNNEIGECDYAAGVLEAVKWLNRVIKESADDSIN